MGYINSIFHIVDADLTHKLDEELQYEQSNAEAGQPEFVKEFLEANSFKVIDSFFHEKKIICLIYNCCQIEDKAGVDEVTLTRTFGNEK